MPGKEYPMDNSCATCNIRRRYEDNPRSLLGRLWRWHTRWCPGWKGYKAALTEEERAALDEHLAALDKRAHA